MRPLQRPLHFALLSTLVAAACGDSTGADTEGSTSSQAQTTSTASDPSGTTDPTDGATTGPDLTGTTGADASTGAPIDSEVYEQCKTNEANAASLADAQCECLVAAGEFADQAACLVEYGTPPDITECVCTVLGEHPDSRAHLDCAAAPEATYTACFTAAGCDDEDAQLTCFEAYLDAVLACPDPPDAANNQVAIDCYGEVPFTCDSGDQVPDSYKCDLEADCMDGSDELGCDNVFMCANGTAIFLDYKCDGWLDCCEGEPECRDMSDEAGCPVFMCMNGEKITEKLRCNGSPDCEDGSDELDCPMFMCMSGDEIPEQWKCDGAPDCEDGSDEQGCR